MVINSQQDAVFAAERLLRASESDLYAAWCDIHLAHHQQIMRLSESAEDDDKMAPGGSYLAPGLETITREHIKNPPEDVHALRRFTRSEDWWFDIGSGGGRHTLFLSKHVKRVTAIDRSLGMRALLEDNIASEVAGNVDVVDSSWPPERHFGKPEVCLAVDVTYFVPDIGLFLDAMDAHAGSLCIVGSTELGTAANFGEPIFKTLHGEPFVRLPGLRELLAVPSSRRRRFDVLTFPDFLLIAPVAARIARGETLDAAHQRVRSHYLVRAGSEKDAHLRELLDEHFGVGDGNVRMPMPAGAFRSLVSWEPPDE